MNSRARVIGALERTQIDRVPVHLACGGPNSAIDALLSHFEAKDRTELLLKMQIDTRSVAPRYVGPPGQAPIGKGNHPREGNKPLKNRSTWGEGEILLARTSFEMKDTDYDLYRLRILCIQGFQVYLNGRKIRTYSWWQDPKEYRKWPIGPREAALLRKGTNTIAIYTMEVYPSAQKPHWKDEVFGQLDCYIEGLRKEDLY